MTATAISKHYKNGRHVGFKKYIGGRNFHLVTGIADDTRNSPRLLPVNYCTGGP